MLALGRPLLSLFGPDFVDGYPLMFILAIGLIARASVGPVERLLNMLGEQRTCAVVYAIAFAVNLVLCFVLIPRFGVDGRGDRHRDRDLVVESTLLFVVTKHRLGLHVFICEPLEGVTMPAPARIRHSGPNGGRSPRSAPSPRTGVIAAAARARAQRVL